MNQGAAGDTARPFRVAVVGGGISGLSAAWYVEKQAAAQGIPVACTVYESADRWGGRIRTDFVDHEAGRFVVEGGPDSFLAGSKPWAVDLAMELGLGGRLLGTNDAARKVWVLSHGRPVPLPDGVFLLVPTKFKPFLLSPLISPLGKLRMGLELFVPPRRGEGDETLGDFVTRRLGSEALDKIAEPLLSGIYNAEAQRQSLLATFPRFRETELQYGSLIRGMLAGKAEARKARKQTGGVGGHGPAGTEAAGAVPGAGAPSGATGSPGAQPGPATGASRGRPKSMFASFVGGTEEIVTGLTRGLQATLRTGVGVRSLHPGAERGYVLDISSTGKEGPADETAEVDAVILAIPAYDAAVLLSPVCPEAAGILGTVRYVSTGTLSLAYKRDPALERLGGFGVLVPGSEKRPLNAVTWSSTKFSHRAPEGHSLLRVFFGGSRSPLSMQLDDEDLLRVVKQQLREISGVTQEPLFHRIYRWDNANAQYDVEHLRRVEAVERALPQGVWVTGSPYRGVGLPDCVNQSRLTATRIVDQLKSL